MALIYSIMVIHIQHISLLKDKLMVEKHQLNATVVQAAAVTRWWRCTPLVLWYEARLQLTQQFLSDQSAVSMAPSWCGLQLPLSSWA